MSARPVSLLIADDQELIREALRAFLAGEPSVEVVGGAANGVEAVSEAKRLTPDVVLMDVRMPGMSGSEATAQIKKSRALAGTRVLMLTSFEDADAVQSCLRAGADGFIGKGVAPSLLISAIHAVRRGESPLSPRAARNVLSTLAEPTPARLGPDPRVEALTGRELEVVALAAQGLGNHAIARRLSIAPTTAKTHITNAMRKLKVHDRAHLVALAYRLGLAR